MHELLQLTLVELTETLRRKQASPVELMKAVIARVDETHETLNAVVSRRDTDELLADAALLFEPPVPLVEVVLPRGVRGR